MAEISVGSATWRDASYKTIRLAQDLRLRPFSCLPSTRNTPEKTRIEDENIQMKSGRRYLPTPPPFNRDLIIDTCNAYACGYMRETRSSMSILRQALAETNHYIHRLQKQRSTLERSHANTRRDLLTNNETAQIRSTRPMSERYPDKVDHLLQEEKKGLHNLKRYSENQLQEISRQLQVLYSHRQKLLEFCKEKGRVLDIISENARPRHHSQDQIGSKFLGPENTDCQAAIRSARSTCEKFRNIQPPNWYKPENRRELKESVTQALGKKADESAHIWEDLTLTSGDVRNMTQRQQRIHDEMETGYHLQLGPVSSLDLSVRERLDRPLVRILQRHPGTQLPESTLISQGTVSLQKSLSKTRDGIGLLHDTQIKLKEDQENKLRGESIDRAAARLRVRSAKGRRERLCL
ncbi:tektin-like protein 1 isoform X2 [Engystomops pustulosus]